MDYRIRAFTIPKGVDEIVERVRKKMKMSRSQFIVLSLTNYLKELNAFNIGEGEQQ
ncbi:MAG: hypothetical protein QXU47_06710 [Candidatus Bathyarchaeia archaeon]